MKNKIIIFLILFLFLTPAVSRAMMMLPTANLTVVANTQTDDSSFNFDLTECPSIICNNSTQINLQTQNLSATALKSITAFSGEKYYLKEESASGLEIKNILCVSNNPNDAFFYQPDTVIFSPKSGENITCTFNNVKAKTPVLIVPGILGTEMNSGSELLWPDLLRMATDIGDSFMDPLQFGTDLTPTDGNVIDGKVVGNPDGLFNYTDGLINEFENQGYTENQDLFTFPYDWRYGVSGKFADGTTNVDLLATKIQDILQQTGSDKVDIVAHSLGGLIVKEYAMNHPTDNHIGKAVFVGVPNTGAPKAIKALLQGDNFGIPWLADSEMKKIAANMPAAYDLLPDQQYYNNAAGSFVSSIDIGYGLGVSEPTEKDLNYDDFKNYLNDKGLNSTAAENSENLHTTDFDNFDLRTAGIDLYAIDGCKAATMTNFLEVKSQDILGNYHTDYDNVELKAGDDTVPLESATNLPIDQNNKYYALVSDHGKMPSEDGIRQEIVNLLSGSNLNISNNLITQDISQCQLNGKAISVFSPINIFVTDQNGNRLGLADDGSIINEIPNADFEMMGDHKFIYLPQDEGEIYTINMQGTDTGTYTIKSREISNSQITNTEVFSDLPVTAELTGSVLINPSDNTTTLSVKQNSDDSSTTILPSATLDAATSQDLLPPVSIATLNGAPAQQNSYNGDVSANIKATDDLSGVLNIGYNLDNAGYQKVLGDTAAFTVSGEGNHTIIFFSTDNAGNNEQEQTITFTIENPPPPPPAPLPLSTPSSPSPPPALPSPIFPVASGSGGNAYVQILNKPSPVIENQNFSASQIALTSETPEIQQTPPPLSPTENPKPILKKITNKSNEVIAKNSAPAISQNSHTKKTTNTVITSAQKNPFLASIENFSSWFINLWRRIFN